MESFSPEGWYGAAGTSRKSSLREVRVHRTASLIKACINWYVIMIIAIRALPH